MYVRMGDQRTLYFCVFSVVPLKSTAGASAVELFVSRSTETGREGIEERGLRFGPCLPKEPMNDPP
jgi:hypothetical protein